MLPRMIRDFISSFHWRKPTTLLASLIIGSVLAGGHHAFYHSLRGQPIANDYRIRGSNHYLTSQQINIAAGSTFAFLIKACLGIAVSSAYEQALWVAVKNRTTELGTMDDLFSLLGNVFTVFKIKLWSKYPAVLFIAAMSWLLPVATVVTPATLTVRPGYFSTYPSTRVPRVDFTNLNFAVLTEYDTAFVYGGPQVSVQRVVEATLAGGNILQISTPATNSSWTLDFAGPALRCNAVNETTLKDISNNVMDYMRISNGSTMYGYLSWTLDQGVNGSLPFMTSPSYVSLQGALLDGEIDVGIINNGSVSSVDLTPPGFGGTIIYVAAFPNIANQTLLNESIALRSCTDIAQAVANATIVQCQLYNASYSTNLTFENGVQTVNMTISQDYGDLTVINHTLGSYNVNESVYSVNDYRGTVESFAYQAVFGAFSQNAVGWIGINTISGQEAIQTRLMSTAVSETAELAFLRNTSDVVQLTFETQAYYNEYSASQTSNSTLSLAGAMEEAFQNATISLMSSGYLQPNYSSLYAPQNTTVTVVTAHNIYAYSPRILWTAYGLAIFFTCLCVIFSFFELHRERAAYSSKFSTIVRMGSYASFSSPLLVADAKGEDPLSKRLSKNKISFATLVEEADDADDGEGLELIVQRPKGNATSSSNSQRQDSEAHFED